ncbi:MAG: sigma-70 family RNA polymerase sigma factor [Flavipsychrobacter sp.]|nr:sigma-70 family RNA polymerase sigma factor [Flavipsychrobacter sp.]
MAENTNIPAGSYKEEEIHTLIRACIAHDRKAQRALYDRYSPVIYGIIKRYEYNDELAMEMLNDSFLKIFTKLSQYSFQGAFEGWMRRIAVNTITDHIRKTVKEKEVIKTDGKEHDGYVEGNIVEGMAYKELLKVVHSLPHMQRTVFNMYVFENLMHKEISEALNINESNCRWYLNDARRRLKDKINSIKASENG